MSLQPMYVLEKLNRGRVIFLFITQSHIYYSQSSQLKNRSCSGQSTLYLEACLRLDEPKKQEQSWNRFVWWSSFKQNILQNTRGDWRTIMLFHGNF